MLTVPVNKMKEPFIKISGVKNKDNLLVLGDSGQIEQLRDRLRREQELVLQLEQDLLARDAALEQARTQLELVRSGRSRRESYSTDREISVFSDQVGLLTNNSLILVFNITSASTLENNLTIQK